MDQILKILNESFFRYFNSLKLFGYVDYEQTNKLILIIHIQELLEDFNFSINEEDYRVFENVLYKLCGSNCLIPYPQYIVKRKSIKDILGIRSTERLDLRVTNENALRRISK